MSTQQISFEQLNPFRRPDWRLERVLQMTDRTRRSGENPGRTSKRDDLYVKGLRNFILRYQDGDDAARRILAYENAGLYYAYLMHERRNAHPNIPITVEARLLAEQTDEEIAAELQTTPEAIHWYEALFFNVRDKLKAHDWIMNHVLMPAFMAGREVDETGVADPAPAPVSQPFYDSTLKFFAYFGKKYILDFVISGFQRGLHAQNSEQVGNWLDNHYMNRMKHRASMAAHSFEVNRYNVMQLFEINNQIINIQRSGDSVENQQDAVTKACGALLRDMKDMWKVGSEGKELVAGTDLAKYDDGASELRDSEAILVAHGRKLGTIEMLDKLPPPKPKKATNGQEDQSHANAQQGS